MKKILYRNIISFISLAHVVMKTLKYLKKKKKKLIKNIAQIISKVSTEEVEKIITDKLGKNNNSQKKVIEKIEATDSGLNLTLNASGNFT
ncbi:hypothetical protein [Lysinibacillus sp. FSL M8-0134]|uniref:hypothetical protein n=1 Tax=Lysinibacillus sp. FSL M8-0134 TaxID=2921717 RepID=UPI00311A0EAC